MSDPEEQHGGPDYVINDTLLYSNASGILAQIVTVSSLSFHVCHSPKNQTIHPRRRRWWFESLPFSLDTFMLLIMPASHCCEFCLRTNTIWHSLRIAQPRIDSNYFVFLVRCRFRISSQANTNVLKCSKHSYWPCESKPIRIASYCIAERRINSCQFLLVRISSLYIRIDSLCIRTGIRRLSAATQYVAIRCATIALS